MGLLGWLFGKKELVFEDRVWCTDATRCQDLLRSTQVARQAGTMVVTFYHHPETLASLQALFDAEGLSYRACTGDELAGDGLRRDDGVGTLFADSSLLPPVPSGNGHDIAKSPDFPPVDIHLAERALIPDPDVAILGLNGRWRNPMRFRAFVSADGELMRLFRIQETVAQLVALSDSPEDEFLTTRWVSRCLRKGQRKLRKAWGAPQPGQSYAEWLRTREREQF